MNAASSRSPRVLLVAGEYPPALGGVADYTELLAQHLALAGALPTVVAREDRRVLAAAGATIPVRRVARDWGFSAWRVLERLIRDELPDIVHVQYQAGAFDGRAAIPLLPLRFRAPSGPRLVVTFHDLKRPYLFPKAGRLRSVAIRYLARASARAIVTNGEDLRSVWRRAPHVHPCLIPIGSNIPAHAGNPASAGQALRGRLGLHGDDVLLGYFGLLGPSKGFETLLEALGRLRTNATQRFQLLVIGGERSLTDRSPRVEPELLTLVAQFGVPDRVHFMGRLESTMAAEALAGCDLVVLPFRDGASWRHGSLLAALAQGCPTITTEPCPEYTADGQLPALIGGENVLLTPPGDAAALAATIASGASDPALRAWIGSRTRELARHFSWERIAAQHLACYDQLSHRGLRP